MFVWDQGVIMPSEMDGFDELDEVFLHLAPEVSDNLSAAVANHLDNGDELAAAQALAAFAERRQLPVSRADRRTLRDVIESHNGDLTCIDLLDGRAGARLNGDTQLLPVLPRPARETVPMRSAPRPHVADVAVAQTAVLPAIRPLGTGAHRRW
ncbi:hypothetical protein AB0I53_15925 [Saccharopolyspora sp. NPDC050389]|uniref:hypothetical protein n=1 Tax=Saccharopolyspora sp. NPDC050389 TaxID=3155516 RepID=UPI0033D76CEF